MSQVKLRWAWSSIRRESVVFGKGLISYGKLSPPLPFGAIGNFNLISVYYWERREGKAFFTSLLIEVPILSVLPKAGDSWCLCELVRCEGENAVNYNIICS